MKITFLVGKYCSSSVDSSQGLQKLADIQIQNFRLRLLEEVIHKPSDPPALLLRHPWSYWDLVCIDCLQQKKPQKAENARTESQPSSETIADKFQAPFAGGDSWSPDMFGVPRNISLL